MVRRNSGDSELSALTAFVERALAAGVDLVQIRERDLTAHALFNLTEDLVTAANNYGARVLVNDRADVAACAGAGAHLTTRSLTADVVRGIFPDMLIGASTHSLQEAEAAEQAGADFIVFGPVFETESKKAYGPPVGVAALRQVASRLQILVLALGGIKMNNYRQALDAGAAGIAAISLFTAAADLQAVVQEIKGR
jgi:thiamine-phosphate pyrophosphorylase